MVPGNVVRNHRPPTGALEGPQSSSTRACPCPHRGCRRLEDTGARHDGHRGRSHRNEAGRVVWPAVDIEWEDSALMVHRSVWQTSKAWARQKTPRLTRFGGWSSENTPWESGLGERSGPARPLPPPRSSWLTTPTFLHRRGLQTPDQSQLDHHDVQEALRAHGGCGTARCGGEGPAVAPKRWPQEFQAGLSRRPAMGQGSCQNRFREGPLRPLLRASTSVSGPLGCHRGSFGWRDQSCEYPDLPRSGSGLTDTMLHCDGLERLSSWQLLCFPLSDSVGIELGFSTKSRTSSCLYPTKSQFTACLARVTEWQTWWTQNPLSERACGFESRPGHEPIYVFAQFRTSPCRHWT